MSLHVGGIEILASIGQPQVSQLTSSKAIQPANFQGHDSTLQPATTLARQFLPPLNSGRLANPGSHCVECELVQSTAGRGCRRTDLRKDKTMVSLRDLAVDRNNNFNLFRVIASAAVLVSHAYPITSGRGANEPFEDVLHIKLGTLGVLTFFAISGFFVSQSFDRRNTVVEFMVARALRLFPGLLLVLFITALVIGPIFTTKTLGSYFFSHDTFLYIPHNLSLKWIQYDLPGVFQNNPYPGSINGSLWSLFYEVACYGLVMMIGVIGVTARHWRFGGFLGIYLAAHFSLVQSDLDDQVLIANFQQLTFPFVIGMAFYQYRQFVPMNALLCAVCGVGTLLLYGTPWFKEAFVASWSYVVFYLGYLRVQPLRMYNGVGDYSYGVYVFSFPIEQIGVAMWKGISPLGLIAVSFPAAVFCAVFSWHMIESRALSYRVPLGRWLANRVVVAGHTGRHCLRRFGELRQVFSKNSA
jgi:peptidoglycan/LPS O-acetylase OafA/YrhL